MFELQQNKVGFYSDMESKKVYTVDLPQILEGVRTGKWAEQVLMYRKTSDQSIKDNLPCFTVGGVFHPTKAIANLVSYSGLLSLDLDYDSTDLEQYVVWNYLESVIGENLVAFFKSTGGKGYCALVLTKNVESYEQFRRVYESVYHKVKEVLPDSIKFDYLPNINRLRYVSYDEKMAIYPSPIPYQDEKEYFTQVALPIPKSERTTVVSFGQVSDDEKIKIVLERYGQYCGRFGERGTRHDWILGLARWCVRADIDQNFLFSYCVTNFHNSARPDVWKNEVARCIRDSYRAYGAERGTVEIEKKFDFDEILRCTNAEQVREQLIMLIADKTNYKKSLEVSGKSSTFVEKEIKFLTKIMNYL